MEAMGAMGAMGPMGAMEAGSYGSYRRCPQLHMIDRSYLKVGKTCFHIALMVYWVIFLFFEVTASK